MTKKLYLAGFDVFREDFGLPVNLMLACSTRIVCGQPRDCLAVIQAHYALPGTP